MKKKVAIILVNFNTFSDTRQCVESLQKAYRNAANFDVIVVDNASTKKNIEIETFLKENTIYFSGGNNVGIRYAMKHDYDYILLLNNDTIVERDFLDKLIVGIEDKEDVGAVIGKIYYDYDHSILWYAGGSVNMKKGIVCQRGFGEKDRGQYDTTEEVYFITGCMMLIPVEVIKKVGLLDDSFFLYAEDLEYSLRLMKKGYKLYYVPNSIIYHKVGASSGRETVSSNTQYYMIRNQLYCMGTYQRGVYRLIGLGYNTLRYLKYIIQKRYSLKIVIEAYLDYFMGKVGKR